MLVLSGVIALFYGILLAHVLAMFRFPVKAGAFLVIDVGRRIYPDPPIASTGCWRRRCDWTLRSGHARNNSSRGR
jgi:hypothetical protein